MTKAEEEAETEQKSPTTSTARSEDAKTDDSQTTSKVGEPEVKPPENV